MLPALKIPPYRMGIYAVPAPGDATRRTMDYGYFCASPGDSDTGDGLHCRPGCQGQDAWMPSAGRARARTLFMGLPPMECFNLVHASTVSPSHAIRFDPMSNRRWRWEWIMSVMSLQDAQQQLSSRLSCRTTDDISAASLRSG